MESKIDETRALVARQGENGCVHIGVDMLFAELLVEALHGALRRIVVFAQVAQHDILNHRVIHLGQKTRRFHVAQMPERPCYSLFKQIGIRAFFKHLHVVVRLDDDIVGTSDLFLHHIVEHPDVGGNSQCMPLEIKMIAHCSSPIVHHGERFDLDAANLEWHSRLHLVEKNRIHLILGFLLKTVYQFLHLIL